MTDNASEGSGSVIHNRGTFTVRHSVVATNTAGVTVATVLAHVAFWDRHLTVCWRGAEGRLTPEEWGEADSWLVNDAIEPLLKAIPGSAAAALATSAAMDVDEVIASQSDAAVDAVRAEDRAWMVDAWEHRGEHIAQIERSLGRA